MSIVIELTLVESANPDEVKGLLSDFLKSSPPIFKSMSIRYVPLERDNPSEEHFFNLTDSVEELGCTTCCMEDAEEPIMMYFDTSLSSPNPNGILFKDRSYTNQESNNTFYMDCENHSNTIVKEEASTFVLKREPSMDVSSLQQFYTKTTSKRKSLLKELPFFTEQPELIQRNDVGTIKVTENCTMVNTTNSDIRCDISTNSKDEFTQPAELLEKSYTKNEIANVSNGGRVEFENDPDDKISNIDDSSSGRSALNEFEKVFTAKVQEEEGTEKDLEDIDNISNGAVEDSSFDRSSLYESQNEPEEANENEDEINDEKSQSIEGNSSAKINWDNLVDVLEAAKRGELTVNENMANDSLMDADIDDEAGLRNAEISGNYNSTLEMLNLHSETPYRQGRYWWKLVKCSQCPHLKFTQAREVVTHILTKHGGQDVPKMYRCRLCSQTSFYRHNLLKEHLKTHSLRLSRYVANSYVEEKWHPTTLMKALELAKESFSNVAQSIERYLIWLVRNGKLDQDAMKDLRKE